MNNWKETTLGEIAEKIFSGGTPSTHRDDFYGGNIPWLRTQEVNFNYIYDTDIKITEEGLKYSSARWTPKNTVVIAMYGNSAGRTAFSKIKTTTNQACCNFVADLEKADPLFVYFNLKGRYSEIEGMANGAAQQNLSVGGLKELKILLPPLPKQKQIASVLSSLDDKIELLRAQNETLEKIAQGIFKEWFVDFKIDGKKLKLENGVPEGWRVGKLTDIADFLNGFAMQKFPAKSKTDYLPVIKIKEMNSGITDQTDKASKDIPDKYIINNGDVLFSWSGSLDIDIWKYGKGALNQHLFKVTSENFPKWFYFYWIKYHLPNFRQIATAKAVTMGHIQRHHLDDAQVIIPSDEFLKKANDLISPIFEKTILNNSQIQTLSHLRDNLLPKLMSGEIKI